MLLVVFGYRELNTAMPDSGTTFTWATRAFGPWLGWMGGWGLIAATVLVLVQPRRRRRRLPLHPAQPDLLRPGDRRLTRVLWINIPITVALTAVAAWISYRGVEATEKVQVWLVAFRSSPSAGSSSPRSSTSPPAPPTTRHPFNSTGSTPVAAGDFSTIAAAVSLSIFLFWGWDTVITMNEEAKDPEKTRGRAAMLTIFAIVIIYLACTIAVISYAGVGTEGLGAGNPENQESIFAALAGPIMGPFAIIVSIAVLSSSLASLQSTMVSPSRTILAMGHYGALPKRYGNVSPRFKSPSVATITSAAAAIIFYVVMRPLSENALWDTITALGLMVCFYYGITGLACTWYFRKSLFVSARTVFFRFLFPLIGGVTLLVIFVRTAIDSLDPAYGSGSSVFGIGLVFVLGIGVLLLGVVIMIVQAIRHPAFFRGETLKQGLHAE